jgi:cell division protein FtsI/penicillin-binding protein 2
LGALLSIFPLIIILQLIRIQTNPVIAGKIREGGYKYTNPDKILDPTRGQILDRRGQILAGNRTVYEVGIDLEQVDDPEMVALTVSSLLGVDYEYALARASIEVSESAKYASLIDNVPPEEIEKIKLVMEAMDLNYATSKGKDKRSLSGLVFNPHLGRYYPQETTGSNLLGFVNAEGEGYFGLEERFDPLLSGTSKKIPYPNDPSRAQRLPKTMDGASLVLSIDIETQQAMEKLIDDSVAETGSDSGTIVVMNPRTGEILAMATTPRMNLNEYWKYAQVFTKDTPFNRAVSQAYEPGSVYKVLTMVAALDNGTVTPETVFIDTGVIEVGGTLIYNWDGGAYGPQNMLGCMQHSLNVCLAWVSTQLGPENFYRYMRAFGIGHVTGIDLAGETSGRLKEPGDNDWYAADLGTNAFGQGVAASPIQMATAISAVANDGVMMAPQIVEAVISEGYQHKIDERVLGVPVKAASARTLTEMLAKSLEQEASDALVTGYRMAGKTGTAEIPTEFGYTSNQTNASFVGWGPVDDPQFLIYVWLEKPFTSQWGSIVASPVFRRAAEQLVVLLNIPPDDIRHKLQKN